MEEDCKRRGKEGRVRGEKVERVGEGKRKRGEQ